MVFLALMHECIFVLLVQFSDKAFFYRYFDTLRLKSWSCEILLLPMRSYPKCFFYTEYVERFVSRELQIPCEQEVETLKN